jgi:sugar phosphate isomerase/epimerase
MGIDLEMKQYYAEVGSGNLDWPDIIAACREIEAKYYIVEQDICPGNSLDSVKISYDNMRAMGLE